MKTNSINYCRYLFLVLTKKTKKTQRPYPFDLEDEFVLHNGRHTENLIDADLPLDIPASPDPTLLQHEQVSVGKIHRKQLLK